MYLTGTWEHLFATKTEEYTVGFDAGPQRCECEWMGIDMENPHRTAFLSQLMENMYDLDTEVN